MPETNLKSEEQLKSRLYTAKVAESSVKQIEFAYLMAGYKLGIEFALGWEKQDSKGFGERMGQAVFEVKERFAQK